MTIDEYGDWAAHAFAATPAPKGQRLAFLLLALLGEAGEAADTIKDEMRGRGLNRERLVYELGDMIYFWAGLCAELGEAPSDMLARSRANIEERLATRAATGGQHRSRAEIA